MIAWIGTITSVTGAFLVALGFIFSGYIAFLIGSTAWLLTAIRRKDRALAALNGIFLCANILGLLRSIS